MHTLFVSVDEEVLQGGVANAGGVTRVGAHVLRPSNPHTPTIHRFLIGLRAVGFAGASEPVGVDPDGRERLVFIPGDVAVPPFPAWVQTPAALASMARLMADMHAASELVDVDGCEWNTEMVDRGAGGRLPAGADNPAVGAGLVICHNDVCPENVVFRDGAAVGFLDFDFAAPGRRSYDLAQFVKMCVPVTDDESARRLGFEPSDRPAKVRLVCDAYEGAGGTLGADGRSELLVILDDSIARGGEWVRSKVEAGHPGFVEMWEQIGGQETFDRRRRWWGDARPEFASALA